MFVLVGDDEIAEESDAFCFDVGELNSLSLSFLPKTRPRMPPLVEDRLSDGPASLPTVQEVVEGKISVSRAPADTSVAEQVR